MSNSKDRAAAHQITNGSRSRGPRVRFGADPDGVADEIPCIDRREPGGTLAPDAPGRPCSFRSMRSNAAPTGVLPERAVRESWRAGRVEAAVVDAVYHTEGIMGADFPVDRGGDQRGGMMRGPSVGGRPDGSTHHVCPPHGLERMWRGSLSQSILGQVAQTLLFEATSETSERYLTLGSRRVARRAWRSAHNPGRRKTLPRL